MCDGSTMLCLLYTIIVSSVDSVEPNTTDSNEASFFITSVKLSKPRPAVLEKIDSSNYFSVLLCNYDHNASCNARRFKASKLSKCQCYFFRVVFFKII